MKSLVIQLEDSAVQIHKVLSYFQKPYRYKIFSRASGVRLVILAILAAHSVLLLVHKGPSRFDP